MIIAQGREKIQRIQIQEEFQADLFVVLWKVCGAAA